MSSDPDASPFNSIPPAIGFLALAIFLIELALSAAGRGYLGGPAGVGWRASAVQSYAFSGPLLDAMMTTGRYSAQDLARFVTYSFVHAGFTHVLFALAFLLALGKMVAETLGSVAALVVFFGSAAFGALAYAALMNDPRPLLGAFPAVYGLIGAFTFILWVRLGQTGDNQYRAFSLIGVLLAIQLVFGLIFGTTNDWVAEVAGFAFGFATAPIVAPGGFRHLLARLRDR